MTGAAPWRTSGTAQRHPGMVDDLFGVVLLHALLGDFTLEYLIGVCPMLAVTRKFETAVGLAIATIAVAPLVGMASYAVLHWLLLPAGIEFIALPVYVLTTVIVVYGAGFAIRRWCARCWDRLAVFQPLLAINCTLLGLILITLSRAQSAFASLAYSLGLALGYGLLLVVIAPLRERLDTAAVPQPFRGIPVVLLALSMLAMALSGFRGVA